MATKSKGSDQKYVKMLAEKINEHLINKFLNDAQPQLVEGKNCQEKEDNIKCSICDKPAKSAAGLKGHMTKMHSGDQLQSQKEQEKTEKDESRHIVKLLLDELVEEHNKNFIDESVKIDEKLMKYENKCDKCDYKSSAN